MNEIIKELAGRDMTLFLGPRPGRKSLAKLKGLNLTHCCTLLSEREDGKAIERICGKIGCAWVWMPLDGGHLDTLRNADLEELFGPLAQALRDVPEPRLYLHCSAGIHRTGFVAYILLRILGAAPDEARSRLAGLREVTEDQIGDDRIALAEERTSQLI